MHCAAAGGARLGQSCRLLRHPLRCQANSAALESTLLPCKQRLGLGGQQRTNEMAAQASPGPPRTPSSARQLSSRSQGELSDEWLFSAPAELVGGGGGQCAAGIQTCPFRSPGVVGGLISMTPWHLNSTSQVPQVCPLTLAPFIDPVLTSAGHVSPPKACSVGRLLAMPCCWLPERAHALHCGTHGLVPSAFTCPLASPGVRAGSDSEPHGAQQYRPAHAPAAAEQASAACERALWRCRWCHAAWMQFCWRCSLPARRPPPLSAPGIPAATAAALADPSTTQSPLPATAMPSCPTRLRPLPACLPHPAARSHLSTCCAPAPWSTANPRPRPASSACAAGGRRSPCASCAAQWS